MKIKINPTPKQSLAWFKLQDKKTKYIVFGGGAGGGKSWCGVEWLLVNCLAHPGTKWFMGREELKRLMASTFITFVKVCQFHKIPRDLWKLNGQYNYIEFANGSRIDLLDLKFLPSDPLYERFGSTEYTSGWIEEAGEVHFGAFDVLKTRIGRHLNKDYGIPSKMFITCNPKKNWLYREIYKPFRNKDLDPNYCFIQSLYGDNPWTAEEYGENLKQIKDKATKERLMFGNWEYDEDPAKLFDYDKILDIFTNVGEEGNKYCIVDVAGRGRDRTVIYIWEGFQITKVIDMDNISNDELNEILVKYKVPRSNCAVDEDGVGFGLVKDTPGVKGFVNGASPIKMKKKESEIEAAQRNYANLKAQCWFELANMVNAGMIGCYKGIPENIKIKIIEDLEQIKQKDMDKDGKLTIIPKEELKEHLGRSTDYGDPMMMRMLYVLRKPIAFGFIGGKGKTKLSPDQIRENKQKEKENNDLTEELVRRGEISFGTGTKGRKEMQELAKKNLKPLI